MEVDRSGRMIADAIEKCRNAERDKAGRKYINVTITVTHEKELWDLLTLGMSWHNWCHAYEEGNGYVSVYVEDLREDLK